MWITLGFGGEESPESPWTLSLDWRQGHALSFFSSATGRGDSRTLEPVAELLDGLR